MVRSKERQPNNSNDKVTFAERYEYLRANLSDNSAPISWEKLVFPDTLSRRISQYADLVGKIGEGESQLSERLREIIERYNKWAEAAEEKNDHKNALYFRHQVKVTSSPQFRERVFRSIRCIESFL